MADKNNTSVAIENAGVFFKDKNGKVGKVNGLTDNDITKVKSALTTIENLKTDPSSVIPDATATVKGITKVADTDTDITYTTTGDTIALTNRSTDKLVTVKGAQTITGVKTFSEQAIINDLRVKTVTRTPALELVQSSDQLGYGVVTYHNNASDGTGTLSCDTRLFANFQLANEFLVPTCDVDYDDTADSHAMSLGTYVAEYNRNIRDIFLNKTTTDAQTVAGATYFYNTVKVMSGDLDAQDASTYVSTLPIENKTNGAASTTFVHNLVENDAILSASASKKPDTQTISSALTVTGALTTNDALTAKGAVNMASASSVTVPTISSSTDSTTSAANTAFVQNAIDYSAVKITGDYTNISGLKDFTGKLNTARRVSSQPYVRYYADLGVADRAVLPYCDLHDHFCLGQDASIAHAHRKTYRGADLISSSHFSTLDDFADAVYNGGFEDIYIGDSISVTASDATVHTFTVADMHASAYRNRSAVLLVYFGSQYLSMNTTDTTAGGLLGSMAYTTHIPELEAKLCTDDDAPLKSMVATRTWDVSNAINTSLANPCIPGLTGVASDCGSFTSSLFMLTDINVFGSRMCSLSAYDMPASDLAYQFPLFSLPTVSTMAQSSGTLYSSYWLGNICSSTSFGRLLTGPGYPVSWASQSASASNALLLGLVFTGKAKS